MTITFEVAPGIIAIDTLMAGRAGLTSAYLIGSGSPTLIETGPATSAVPVATALNDLGIANPDLAHIVVTHIHLDHAGGGGHIAERFPNATVWVHEIGARHLADPSRLMASATRVYGLDRLTELFGVMLPVPADRIRSFAEADKINLGDRVLTALYTPGHASHHLAIQDSLTGAVFTGDALGVHLPEVPFLRPAAPPPDFDIEQAVSSIQRIREHTRGTLLFSHFGPDPNVEETCQQAVSRIREWGEIVRRAMAGTSDSGEIARALRDATASELSGISEADLERLETVGSYEINAAGLSRYWKKRAEAKLS